MGKLAHAIEKALKVQGRRLDPRSRLETKGSIMEEIWDKVKDVFEN